MVKILHVFNTISSLRERYYAALTSKESLIKILSETEIAEQVYNSNAIENSTLTLEETEKILYYWKLKEAKRQDNIIE